MSVWEEHNFTTVPLFSRKEHFQKMDVKKLAAFEFKKKTWKFAKKFEKWIKKLDSGKLPRQSLNDGVSHVLSIDTDNPISTRECLLRRM